MLKQTAPTKYAATLGLSPERFRRLTGVTRTTFKTMLSVLRKAHKARRKRGGYAPTLCLEDQLLMALEYWREYRTYFHLGQSYGLSESQTNKIVRRIEDTLVRDRRFALPGKKVLATSDLQFEVVLIDVAETPIERPKKDSGATTPVKRSGIR
jgi:hypothetical protein